MNKNNIYKSNMNQSKKDIKSDFEQLLWKNVKKLIIKDTFFDEIIIKN